MEFEPIPRTMPPLEGIRFVARVQCEQAAAALRLRGYDPSRAVHAARVRMKALRALLRLIRPVLDPGVYRHENAFCRDLARRLSRTRDLEIMTATLKEVAAAPGRDPVDASAIDAGAKALRQRLGGDGEDASAEQSDAGDASAAFLAALAGELEEAAVRTTTWHCTKTKVRWKHVAEGLAATYRRARRDFRKAKRSGDPDAYHRARKWTKYLFYQLAFLVGLSGRRLKRMGARARELGHLLGLAHDAHVLRAKACECCAALEGAGESEEGVMQALVHAIDHREEGCLREARKLGRRLFRVKPGELRRHARRTLARRAAKAFA